MSTRHDDLGVGDVAPRTQQLCVAHQQLRVERVAGAEEQVAADHPLAGHDVRLVARALEPVVVAEDRFAHDLHPPDDPPGIGFEQPVGVEHAPLAGRVAHGTEQHAVHQARHGPAAGFGTDAVVEPLVALGGPGYQRIRFVRRAARLPLRGGNRTGCKTERRDCEQSGSEYADPNGHVSKLTYSSSKKYVRRRIRPTLRTLRTGEGGRRGHGAARGTVPSERRCERPGRKRSVPVAKSFRSLSGDSVPDSGVRFRV